MLSRFSGLQLLHHLFHFGEQAFGFFARTVFSVFLKLFHHLVDVVLGQLLLVAFLALFLTFFGCVLLHLFKVLAHRFLEIVDQGGDFFFVGTVLKRFGQTVLRIFEFFLGV